MKKPFFLFFLPLSGCIAPGIYELVVIVFLIIFFIVPIFVTYNITGKKKRNRLGWTITSILFGWISVIIIALLPEKNN